MANNNVPSDKIFFPGLDGLRFIAAALVIVNHVENRRNQFDISNFLHINFFSTVGYYGVTLFFVLSGFLITYLILKEVEKYGKVNIRHFYIRRALRIWPLYFFIILTGLFLWSKIPMMHIPLYGAWWDKVDWRVFMLYAFFLPQFAQVYFDSIPYIDQTWSVGVEEQFYLVWPILISLWCKNILRVLVLVIFIMLLLKTGALYFHELKHRGEHILLLINLSRFGCMATGGIAAYAYFKNKEYFLRFVLRKDVFIMTLIFTAALLGWGFSNLLVASFLAIIGFQAFLYARSEKLNGWKWYAVFPAVFVVIWVFAYAGHFNYPVFDRYANELIALPFAAIILNISAKPGQFSALEHPIMQYLGRISYGAYMYHNIMITLSLRLLLATYPALESIFGHIVLYGIAFGLTIGCSALSYELLEKPFLQMKKRFAKVHSGANG